jgi:hypothetical protein
MFKRCKIICLPLIILLTFFFACSKKKPNKPEPPKYKWTILGYFDGNNSQDQAPDGHSYVIKDLQELEGIDSTQQVQILVMLGSFKTSGNCKYYHVQRHLNEPPDHISSEVVLDLGKKDMSDPTILRDFLGFGVQNYPAEHYMLIINDHGGGWKGVCSDNVNSNGSWMSLPDLSYALWGFTFDIVLFYTPSMATAEAAYQMKERGEYMIASQFKYRPDNILGATALERDSAWLPYLTDNPDMPIRDFARKVTQAIYKAAMKIELQKHVHSVLIHLPKISGLTTDISNLGRSLIDSTGAYWSDVWDAWYDSHNYEDLDSVFVDLREFARKIQGKPSLNSTIRDYAHAVETSITAINGAVITQFMYPNYYAMLGGISIHFPWNQNDFDSTSYAQLDFSKTNWDDFISVFIQSFSGNYAGTLNLSSVPTGARVFLNEKDTGDTTNVKIEGLFPGFHIVKLVKDGYKDYEFDPIYFHPRQTIELTAYLKPGP